MSDNKIIVPEDVKRQIDYLHTSYPDKEWSGILVYTTENADFGNLEGFTFKVQGIYPMDLGKASYTEFDYNTAIAEVYDIFEKRGISIEDLETGMIHSHHNMKAYFSGTDMDELKTNAKKHNYYLSLVVNVEEVYAAKVAFPSKVTISEVHKILDKQGTPIEIPRYRNSESILTLDLDIIIEGEEILDDWFKERINVLKKENEKPAWGNYTRNGYGRFDNSAGRSWKPDTQTKLFEDYSKPKNDPTENFLIDLGGALVNKSYFNIYTMIRDFATTPYIKGLFSDFDKTFTKVYIKHFKGKPSDIEELADLLTEILVIMDSEEAGLTVIEVVDSCLDELKQNLYEQIPK